MSTQVNANKRQQHLHKQCENLIDRALSTYKLKAILHFFIFFSASCSQNYTINSLFCCYKRYVRRGVETTTQKNTNKQTFSSCFLFRSRNKSWQKKFPLFFHALRYILQIRPPCCFRVETICIKCCLIIVQLVLMLTLFIRLVSFKRARNKRGQI